MLSELMKAERVKLIQQIQEKTYVRPEALAALALIGILEILENQEEQERINAFVGE